MPTIALLTDFGVQDAYVGMMKGVILSIHHDVQIIDITHDIDPQDVISAAYTIKSVHHFFPANTIYVVVVDPGVGTSRSIILVKIKEQFFLAPDNGVLTLLMDEEDADLIIKVSNPEYFLASVSQTFHGRDIFSPVAAYLSKGIHMDKFGPRLKQKDLVTLNLPQPFLRGRKNLNGIIIASDRFGNLITNIDSRSIERFFNRNNKKTAVIKIKGQIITGLSSSYHQTAPNLPLAIIGSSDYLEIAVNRGSAKLHYNAGKGDAVQVSCI